MMLHLISNIDNSLVEFTLNRMIIIKLQATNASLNEAALLDRTRLHDQAMRIDQLESEHKALLDRISCLQAAETGAQRGIVRLQVSALFGVIYIHIFMYRDNFFLYF
ncbi:unnamed protein product [Trichobilharzia regenti]|nr:unnamed protein product [Trichobilharzia regenti]